MWPFTNKQERQAEAMSMILAENSYERKMERMAGWVRTFAALIGGVALTFGVLFGLDALGYPPSEVWDYITNR
tara:strand:- start:3336 stop:3554 length:219 start_codon:yes stop_codon:yes gene_type:complete